MKKSFDDREPDDSKDGARAQQVGRRERGDYEDVEDARKSHRDDDDGEEISDDDIVEIVDLA